jgi:hypothetical protein
MYEIFTDKENTKRRNANLIAPSLVFIRRLFQFSHTCILFRISNFYFDLSITEETLAVKMRIWSIKNVNVLALHL